MTRKHARLRNGFRSIDTARAYLRSINICLHIYTSVGTLLLPEDLSPDLNTGRQPVVVTIYMYVCMYIFIIHERIPDEPNETKSELCRDDRRPPGHRPALLALLNYLHRVCTNNNSDPIMIIA